MGSQGKVVCVTGASGFIGSWLVMRLLEREYIVRPTVRDPDNDKKVKHLLDLSNAETNLTLWKADLSIEGSYDDAIGGCNGVFHVATPMDFESKDPETTIEGMLSIMRACKNANVRKIVFTSSVGTLDVEEHNKPVYEEHCWSDLEFVQRVKMTGWMYFVSKTQAEKAAWEYAKEHKLDFISIIPSLVVGPFITPSFPPSLITALSLITRTESHYHIIRQGHYVHLDDLCMSHIYLYELPTAEGRYICSSHDAPILDLAKILNDKYPEYKVPTEFSGENETSVKVIFSSKKLKTTGFEFKYSLEDMFTGAVEKCREKGLLPLFNSIASIETK